MLSQRRPEWVTFRAGQNMLCPAPRRYIDARGEEHTTCDRNLGEVGRGLGVRVRVHPGGKHGRAGEHTTCRDCPRCSTRLEFAEERRAEDREADVRSAA